MKVLHVITGLDNGGAEGALFRLVMSDTANSHVVISMTGAGVYGSRLAEAGVIVHALAMPRGRITWSGLRRMYGVMRTAKVDVVQTWMYHADLIGGAVARLAGHRAVAWGVRAADAHRHAAALSARALVPLCALASHVIPRRIVFNSAAGSRWHGRAGYSKARSLTIPNGYDMARLRPDLTAREGQRARWGLPHDAVVFGMVARWDPLKDHATFAAALQRLAESQPSGWFAVLVGPGMTPDNAALASLFAPGALAARVTLAGPSDDIPAIMNAFDVHVLSSRSEAFPNVIPEAMACGTPCVTTDVGDAAAIVGDTGWVVPFGNASALADGMRQALSQTGDRAQWERRRDACRSAIATRFSIEMMVESYNRVWSDVRPAVEQ